MHSYRSRVADRIAGDTVSSVDRPELADDHLRAAAQLLLTGGPMTLDGLVDALLRGGFLDHMDGLHPDDRRNEVAFALEESDAFCEFGGMVGSTEQLLDGITLTHEISRAELDHGAVTLTPDLGAIDADGCPGFRLPGGGTCVVAFPPDAPGTDENGSLVGPSGWLEAIDGPGLAAFGRRGTELMIETDPDVTDDSAELDGLRASIAMITVPGVGFEADEVVIGALMADPSLFRHPTRPVGALLEELGFERSGAWFGPADEEWAPPGQRYLDDLVEAVADRWGFSLCCAEAFDIVRSAWSASLDTDPLDQATRRTASKALIHEPVSQAFVDFVLQDSGQGSASLAGFATQLIDQPRSARAPGHFLLAMNAERDRDIEAVEGHLAEAVQLEPDYSAALAEYAWFVADRGDAARASSLLQRAGAGPGDPEFDYLVEQATHSAVGTNKVGRNDPCPCGSGIRYKQCCINGSRTTIEQRAGWLSQKLERFALRPVRRGRISELVASIEAMGGEVTENVLPVLVDVVAWEPDVFQEFMDTRGYLLPDDELFLLQGWSNVRLELYEVVDADPGSTLTVRDTRTGEQVVVSERTASRSLVPGTYLLTRIAPAGSQLQIVGVVLPVSLSHRESVLQLLDGGCASEDVAAWLAWISRPPTIRNREGHDLVLCTTTLRPAAVEWDHVAGVLDREFRPVESGSWNDTVDIDGEPVVRAVLRRDGGDLVVETNSVIRAEEALERLLTLEGVSFEVIDSVRTSPDELDTSSVSTATSQRTTWLAGDDTSDMPDEIRRVLEDVMVEQERKWIEEPVPALGGLSPRDALTDPTRREDLMALLAEFDRRASTSPSVGTFDVDRIRALLGM